MHCKLLKLSVAFLYPKIYPTLCMEGGGRIRVWILIALIAVHDAASYL